MAAPPLLLRCLPLLRLHLRHHRHSLRIGVLSHCHNSRHQRTCCTATEYENSTTTATTTATALNAEEPPKYPRLDDPDYRRWKDKEAEILRDVEPIILLTKDILHSDRYLDGERLTAEDERAVVEMLLAYHPRSEDKIGSGLDSIMVDRHPQFRHSRCLFVVRTDGGWIDFSYQKCVRAYIRDKYPSHAERFIKVHFKRGSS